MFVRTEYVLPFFFEMMGAAQTSEDNDSVHGSGPVNSCAFATVAIALIEADAHLSVEIL